MTTPEENKKTVQCTRCGASCTNDDSPCEVCARVQKELDDEEAPDEEAPEYDGDEETHP